MKKLNDAQDAIQQAIEGGWKGAEVEAREGSGFLKGGINLIDEQYYLDPLFWRALGKARGWGDGEKGWLNEGKVVPMMEEWKSNAVNWLLARFSDEENKFWQSLP